MAARPDAAPGRPPPPPFAPPLAIRRRHRHPPYGATPPPGRPCDAAAAPYRCDATAGSYPATPRRRRRACRRRRAAVRPHRPPPPPPGAPGGRRVDSTATPGSNPQGGKKTPWFADRGDRRRRRAGRCWHRDRDRHVRRRRHQVRQRRRRPSTTPDEDVHRRRAPSTHVAPPRRGPTDPGDARGSFDAQLMALIPLGLPDAACARSAIPPAPGALATVDCRKSDAARRPEAAARTRSSPNQDTLQPALRRRRSRRTTSCCRCPAPTPDSPITWHYKTTPDVVAGQVACGTYQGNADIMWTQDDDLLLADVQSARPRRRCTTGG